MVEAWFSDQTAIFVQEENGTEIDMTVKILEIKESGFDRETEGTVTFGDGRIVQKKPQKDGMVEIQFVMTDSMADKIFWGSTVAGTAPSTIYSGGEQNKHRVTILRTNDPSLPASTSDAVTSQMYRRSYVEAYGVTLEPEHEADGFLKGKLTFTISPTDASADPNVRIDSTTDGTTTVGVFGDYATDSKW